MPLQHWKAWGIYHLSMKLVPVFKHPLDKEMLPKVQFESPMAQLWTITMCPTTGYQGGRDQHLLPALLSQLGKGACTIYDLAFHKKSEISKFFHTCNTKFLLHLMCCTQALMRSCFAFGNGILSSLSSWKTKVNHTSMYFSLLPSALAKIFAN